LRFGVDFVSTLSLPNARVMMSFDASPEWMREG
jgi:hypothetical protein